MMVVFKAAMGRSKVTVDYFFRKIDIKRQDMIDGEEAEDKDGFHPHLGVVLRKQTSKV